MSDILNPPRIPDDTCINCPDCGCMAGTACGAPTASWNCGARIWVAQQIAAIESLRQGEPPPGSAVRDEWASGWNDAIEAILERMRGLPRAPG